MITGQMVHDSYNKVLFEDMQTRDLKKPQSTIRKWEDLSKREKSLYDSLAAYLNAMIAEQGAQHE